MESSPRLGLENHIGPFRLITYMHRFVYQIMGPKLGYDLGRC